MNVSRTSTTARTQRDRLRTGVGLALSCALLVLGGCALPDKPARASVYDFGPMRASSGAARAERLAPIVLADVQATAALDSTALLYRLGYADAQQLRPYALARWSITPALLLQQRVRERLGEQRSVLRPPQVALASGENAAPWVLQLELEEFSQWFDSPAHSEGLLRLRATVTQATSQGERLLGQRSFAVRRAAPQADAAGAVRALTLASDGAIDELLGWLPGLRP